MLNVILIQELFSKLENNDFYLLGNQLKKILYSLYKVKNKV